MTLVETLAISTANQRVVSPLLCGSHPYPYGSLTYRFFILTILHLRMIVNPKWLFLKISFHSYCGKQRTILLQISSTKDLGAAIIASSIENDFGLVMQQSKKFIICQTIGTKIKPYQIGPLWFHYF